MSALFAPPTTSAHIRHYGYCVLDLETRSCDAATIARVRAKLAEQWEPPANYKDKEKIDAKREADLAKAVEKSAIWDAAPIATICIKSDTEFRLLHCLEAEKPRLVGGATVQGFKTEKEMLTAFSNLVQMAWVLSDGKNGLGVELGANIALADGLGVGLASSPTELVGHNILGFDLPKLRLRSLVREVGLARGLLPPRRAEDPAGLPVFDTMRQWCRFSRDQRPFVPLSDIVDGLGIVAHKQIISGADVPALIEAKKFEDVITYALLDGLATEQAYLLMTGRGGKHGR